MLPILDRVEHDGGTEFDLTRRLDDDVDAFSPRKKKGIVGDDRIGATMPGELHDLPLIIFGIALAARGWAIPYLGPDTPVSTIQEALDDVDPRLVVIASVTTEHFRAARPQLAELARRLPVALAGAGATDELVRATGAFVLESDPVTAAERVAAERR